MLLYYYSIICTTCYSALLLLSQNVKTESFKKKAYPTNIKKRQKEFGGHSNSPNKKLDKTI